VTNNQFTKGRRRTLVTGGAGFIGSSLVDVLVARGDHVTIVDDLSAGSAGAVSGALEAGARLRRVDVTDLRALTRVVRAAQPDVILHLAAQTDVNHSLRDACHDARVNVTGTVNVLAVGCERVVLASTAAVYGDAGIPPLTEDTAKSPSSGYGHSKLAAEGYLNLYSELHGLSTVCLRFANVYGPGDCVSGEPSVITRLCAALASGESFTLYGDGHQTRDFIHVDDVVEALVAAGDGSATGVFNVASGVEHELIDVIAALEQRAGRPLALIRAPQRDGEVHRSALDPSRSRDELRWAAQVSLSEGLDGTLAHAQKAVAPRVPERRRVPKLAAVPRPRVRIRSAFVLPVAVFIILLVAPMILVAEHTPLHHLPKLVLDLSRDSVETLRRAIITLGLCLALAVVAIQRNYRQRALQRAGNN